MTDAASADKIAATLKKLNEADRVFGDTNLRPKDAATLLILDRAAGGPWRVLMGRRHMRHKFFPGAYVFPGGRVDPMDGRTARADDYHPAVLAKLLVDMKGPKGETRARGIGLAAVRETYEEAGLFIGRRRPDGPPPKLHGDYAAFGERDLLPALGALRFVARAITPPRRPRRFDTRFLACFAADVADRLPSGLGPSGELEDVAWLTFEEAKKTEIPSITVTVIEEVADRLAGDPGLDPAGPTPFYRWLPGGFRRVVL